MILLQKKRNKNISLSGQYISQEPIFVLPTEVFNVFSQDGVYGSQSTKPRIMLTFYSPADRRAREREREKPWDNQPISEEQADSLCHPWDLTHSSCCCTLPSSCVCTRQSWGCFDIIDSAKWLDGKKITNKPTLLKLFYFWVRAILDNGRFVIFSSAAVCFMFF